MVNKEFSIVIDLDGTLKTDYDYDGPFEADSITLPLSPISHKDPHTFAIRPHIKTFLKEASEIGKLYIGTAAIKEYAEQALESIGIRDYFEDIITSKEFNSGNVPSLTNYILIDNNLDIGSTKMRIMEVKGANIIREDLWVIDTYAGNSDDRVMLDLVEKLKEL